MFRGIRGRAALCAGLSVTVALCAAAAAGACPNERFRVGPSAQLPECRAYEMVSPPDKGNGGVDMHTQMRTAPSGEAVMFASTSAFAGAPSSPVYGFYVSRRAADWTTESVEPPQLNERKHLFMASAAASPDLGKTLQVSRAALAPGAIEGGSNLYLRDNLSGERTVIAAQPGRALYEALVGVGGAPYLDGTADWSNLVFESEVPLVPGAPAGVGNLYEYEEGEGELRIVNQLPDGTISPDGAHIGYFASELPRSEAMSDDGSRVFFNTGGFGTPSPLYMREDGEATVPISESQRAGEAGVMGNAQFGGAAADGSVVYFLSEANLTEASETHGRLTLYRYTVASGELRDLTIAPELPEGARLWDVLALSADGSHLYFSAVGALTEEASESPLDANLYVWREGEIEWFGRTYGDAFEFGGPYRRLASPSGRYFAFSAFSALTPGDVPSPACPVDPERLNPPGACEDVYLYDSATEALTCLTCSGPGLGFSGLGGLVKRSPGLGDELPRAVLDDGTVFFDSPNRLLAADADALTDVYAWRHGELSLLSPGTDRAPANFGDATADGRTVFIRTAEPLLARDLDAGVDAYAVRVEGGLAAQQPLPVPPVCPPEDCRGPLPAAADPAAIATAQRRATSKLPSRCARLMRRGRVAARTAARLEGERAQRRRAASKRLLAKAQRCARSAR